MSDRPDTWMPLFIADYLKDTQHLSTTEHGAYLLLLMKSWTSGGVLPLDERRLARIAGLDPKEWKASREALLEFFQEDDDGYRHKRVTEELARADSNLEQKRAAGRASAEKRAAQRERQRALNGRSTDDATEVQRTPQRKSNPSPSPVSSLRSDTPPNPQQRGFGPPGLHEVIQAGGFAVQPADHRLLAEWLALPDMDLQRDILPMIRRMAEEEMQKTGKAPFTLKFFDGRIREQHAADHAEIARLRRGRARAERLDAEQRDATATA